MLGLGLGLRKRAKTILLLFKSLLVQAITSEAVNGIYIDKIGSWSPEYRVGGWIFEGTISTGLISTSVTYTDPSTLLPVVSTTDGSGDFATPVGGIVDFTIAGHYFPLEETTGAYVGATDATYYAITGATWTRSDEVPGYADDNGYTPADGSTMYWDIDTSVLIPSGVNITRGAGYLGDAYILPINLLDQALWELNTSSSVNSSIESDRFNCYQSAAGSSHGVRYLSTGLENNTEYMLVVNTIDRSVDGSLFRAKTVTNATLTVPTGNQQHRLLFTTANPITDDTLFMYIQSGTNDVSYATANVGVYKVADLPDPLDPTNKTTNPIAYPIQ